MMKARSLIPVLVILFFGAVATLLILRPETIPLDFIPKHLPLPAKKVPDHGPHGGTLLSRGDLRVEVKLHEAGTPPRFRIYITNAKGQPLPLNEIQVQIELIRLDRTEVVHFQPQGNFLQGDKVVAEPHSFDIKVNATWKGEPYEWAYSHYEARAVISEEDARNAGIEVTPAGPATLKTVTVLPGEIVLNEKRVAHVVPRMDALVVEVYKDLGDPVRKGEILAVLESRELADAINAYLASIKRAEPVRIDYERQKLLYQNTLTMLDLLEENLDLDMLYAKINKLELGESRELIVPAYARLLRTRSVYEREKSLYEKKISSESEYLQALEDYKSAEARYLALREKAAFQGHLAVVKKNRAWEIAQLDTETARQKLLALGLSPDEIKQLSRNSGKKYTRYPMRATLDGIVIQKHIVPGEAVKKDASVFILADLSEVWVNIAIPEKNLDLVKLGQEITVKSQNQRMEATGTLAYLGSVVDEKLRTVTGRLVIPNPEQRWRPGMFVTVELVRSTRQVPVGVPLDAVQTLNDWQVVFINKGTIYEARPLTLGERDGQWVEVLEGLRAGTPYVSKNSFAVKAEILKSEASHDH